MIVIGPSPSDRLDDYKHHYIDGVLQSHIVPHPWVRIWLEDPDYQKFRVDPKPKEWSEMTEVVLVDERVCADSRRVWASLGADGSLMISGQDIGPIVERFFGADEYEWSHTIPAQYIKQFFALLGLEVSGNPLNMIHKFGGHNYEKLGDALELAKESMPIEFWSRH